MDDGVPVNGEDGGVPVPDPGHGVVVDLVDPAGQVGHLPLPHRDVPRGVEGEVGPGVQSSQLGGGQTTGESWREKILTFYFPARTLSSYGAKFSLKDASGCLLWLPLF